MASWAEQYVDQQVEQAWLSLRMQLAERLHVGLEADHLEPFEMTIETGESLTVNLDDDRSLSSWPMSKGGEVAGVDVPGLLSDEAGEPPVVRLRLAQRVLDRPPLCLGETSQLRLARSQHDHPIRNIGVP